MHCYRFLIPFFFTANIYAAGHTYTGRIVTNTTPPLPVASATVSIANSSITAYSDSTGIFTLNPATSLRDGRSRHAQGVTGFTNGTVSFFCKKKEEVRIDLITLKGRTAGSPVHRRFAPGNHSFPLSSLVNGICSPGVYMAAVTKTGERHTAKLLVTGTSAVSTGGSHTRAIHGTDRFAAGTAADSLIVSRKGFLPVTRPLPDSSSDLGDVAITRTPEEKEIEQKVDSLLALMTLAEKAGQMVQAQINFTGSYHDRLTDEDIAVKGIGSVFNGGSDASLDGQPNTPDSWAAAIDRIQGVVLNSSSRKIPIIYAQDCVHGVAEIDGCTVFPHNIGLGCTWDTALVAEVGRITARECTGIGIRFNFWPCIASVRNERWGRAYEGFGETPEINTLLGTAYIRGLQGDGTPSKVGAIAACAKHFLGDGGTNDGINNGEMSVSETTMRAVHLPQYAASVREQIATIMPSYHSWIRDTTAWVQTLDYHSQTSILKTGLGFDGFCISDWDAIPRACGSYEAECVAQAINAGLDMAMVVGDVNCGAFIDAVTYGVENEMIPAARIDDAVRRILRIKFRFGLFDHPYSDPAFRSQINSPESRAVARECVRKSLVLLKNDDTVLPLKKEERIVVAGPWATSLGAQCGGWTISWQGSVDHTGISGQTILQGLQELGSNVTYGDDDATLANADKIVVVLGELPYAEQYGDTEVPDLSQLENAYLVEQCFNSGKPVVLVMLTGRPMLIDTELPWCKAVVAAWLPGGEGGGVADVLFGDHDFSGKLTHTWPASAQQIPINTGPVYPDEQQGSGGEPLYPYGYGLTYQ